MIDPVADDARERPVPPVAVPVGLAALVAGYDWARDLVGESGGSVWRLYAAGKPTLYLKHGADEVAPQIVDEFARLYGSRATSPFLASATSPPIRPAHAC
jgi:aminoglycoside 3'-phosphotransferase-1